MKLLNAIKSFIFNTPHVVEFNAKGRDIAQEALALYCPICKRSFKSSAGAAAHRALKHKHG